MRSEESRSVARTLAASKSAALGKRARAGGAEGAGSPVSVFSVPATRACTPATSPEKRQPKRARVGATPEKEAPNARAITAGAAASSEQFSWALGVPSDVWGTVCRFLTFTQTARLSIVSSQLRTPCNFRIAHNPDALPLTVPGDFLNLSSAAHALRVCAELRRAVAVLELGPGEHAPMAGSRVEFTNIDGLIVRGVMTEKEHITRIDTVIKGKVMVSGNVTLEGLKIESDCNTYGIIVMPIDAPEHEDSADARMTVRMHKCHVSVSDGCGVIVCKRARLVVERCRLSNNTIGLLVQGPGSGVAVKHCTVVENHMIGICAEDHSRCDVTGYTRVKDNGQIGVYSRGLGSVINVQSGVLRHNKFCDAFSDARSKCAIGVNAICDRASQG